MPDVPDQPAAEYLIGISVGIAGEATGLAVVERIADDDARYGVLHLARLTGRNVPKATVAEVTRLYAALEERDLGRQMRYRRAILAGTGIELGINRWDFAVITVAADVTGSGPAGVEPLRRAGFWPEAVTLHGGFEVSRDPAAGWRVPKRDVAGRLDLLFAEGRLAIPGSLPEAELLRTELAAFRPRVSLTRDPGMADDVWRANPGDALVLAVGVACWHGEANPAPVFPVAAAIAATF